MTTAIAREIAASAESPFQWAVKNGLPEDLVFTKGGRTVVSVIAHEQEILVLRDEEDVRRLRAKFPELQLISGRA